MECDYLIGWEWICKKVFHVAVHAMHPLLSFLIGLSIILLASLLNAAGLNLTKLDHVHASALPLHARPNECHRPLWLLGIILYM